MGKVVDFCKTGAEPLGCINYVGFID